MRPANPKTLPAKNIQPETGSSSYVLKPVGVINGS